MKYRIIIFYLLLSLNLYSQRLIIAECENFLENLNVENNHTALNQIQQIIKTNNTEAKVDTLIKYSEQFIREKKNIRITECLLQLALSISHNLNYNNGVAKALYNSGNNALILTDQALHQTAVKKYEEALPYFKKSGDLKGLMMCIESMAYSYHHMGQLDKTIRLLEEQEIRYLKIKDTISYINTYAFRGHCYFDKGNFREAYEIGIKAWKLAEKTNDTAVKIFCLNQLANLFNGVDLPDAALEYIRIAKSLFPASSEGKRTIPKRGIWTLVLQADAFFQQYKLDSAFYIMNQIPKDNTDSDYPLLFGRLYVATKDFKTALQYFHRGYDVNTRNGLLIASSRHADEIGRTFLQLKRLDSAEHYARLSLKIAQKIPALLEMKNAVNTLTDIYVEKKDYERVYFFTQWHKRLNDSVAPEDMRQRLALVQLHNQLENQKQESKLLAHQNELKEQQLATEGQRKNFLIIGLVLMFLFGLFILRSNHKQKKSNHQLRLQKQKLQQTLSELYSTQEQLVQKEKMASLGELTAGIAHEIQNPLNFVNNFSEVSTELLDEMQAELKEGNASEALHIATDIKENLSKINHHGKRADAIVKSMLQHSRKTTGTKEPADLNALVDEYLRLSYHGFRARDKNFNVILETHYDPSVGNVTMISQDIGRVLLNLFNNAFYSVDKKKTELGKGYEPTVIVRTVNKKNKIEVCVKDNGIGIPQSVLDKIFQPFFTTKPTGEGTGLGLSLSYDIIKAHGGELKVNTEEGEGAEFKIIIK
jgi:two-component system, NtrC family, sensor kinase